MFIYVCLVERVELLLIEPCSDSIRLVKVSCGLGLELDEPKLRLVKTFHVGAQARSARQRLSRWSPSLDSN